MPDWDQFARNLLYGAVHRPAQLVRWVGEQLNHDPSFPVGAPLIAAANQVDTEAGIALNPYVPPLGLPTGLSGPPPPPPPPPPPSPLSASLSAPSSVVTFQPFSLTATVLGGTPPYTINFNGPPDFGGYAPQTGVGPFVFKGVLLYPSYDGYVFTVSGTDAAGTTFSASARVFVYV